MYPVIRMLYQMAKARRLPPLGYFDTHVSQHICWPWDIDLWMELNNGRTLTLFDLGRLPMSLRNGSAKAIRDNRLGLAVAGASVRYRKRVTTFQRIEMRTRAVGYDDRFLYMEQSMWNGAGDCCNHVLIRGAVTRKGKMINPQELADMVAPGTVSPALPAWVQGWVEADRLRPWPPMQDS